MKKILSTILIVLILLLASVFFLKRPATKADTIKVKSTTEGITLKAGDS